ncbi:MAG TPA: hypothetical protein VLF09_16485 [Cellvibrio sp.]|nr:hypothetical protein [Cellvibrio sp.]
MTYKNQQLYFYIHPNEMDVILDKISLMGAVIYAPHSKSNIPTTADIESDATFYITYPEFSEIINMRRAGNNGYFIDDTTSPVIELNKSFLRGNCLSRGRIYFRNGFDGREAFVSYPQELGELYKKIIKELKENFLTKEKIYLGYISKDSKVLLNSGGTLSQF